MAVISVRSDVSMESVTGGEIRIGDRVVTLSSPATMRNSVDLPQPEGPTKTQNSPSLISRSMP